MASEPSKTITARLHWAEHLAIWAAVTALLFDVGWSIVVERPIQREEAIVRAWQVVLTPTVGNAGKGQAMSVLAARGQPLNNVDLSCETMARQLGRETELCNFNTPSIFNLNLDYPRPATGQGSDAEFFDGRERAYMRGLNLSQNELWDPVFANLVLQEAEMERTQFHGMRVENAALQFSSATAMVISDARWRDTIFTGDMSRSTITFLEATNVIFDNINGQDMGLGHVEPTDPITTEVVGDHLLPVTIEFVNGDLSDAIIEMADYSDFELMATNVSNTLFGCSAENNLCLEQIQETLSLAWARPDEPPTYAGNRWTGREAAPVPLFRNFCNDRPEIADSSEFPRFEGQGEVTFPRLIAARPDLCTIYIDLLGALEP